MPGLMHKKTIVRALLHGEITVQGQPLQGSNYTFLSQLHYGEISLPIIYKPDRGERPLWDFPRGTLARRESAAFLVSEALKWDLVPPTVYRRSGPLGAGSVQFYIQHEADYHYFKFSSEELNRLRPVVVFDLLVNNADRKGGHILRDENQHLWLIDHGLCFHSEEKLRTVIWDFAGEPIPASLLEHIQLFLSELDDPERLLNRLLIRLLSQSEVDSMKQRARVLLERPIFPLPAKDRRPYPWPPV